MSQFSRAVKHDGLEEDSDDSDDNPEHVNPQPSLPVLPKNPTQAEVEKMIDEIVEHLAEHRQKRKGAGRPKLFSCKICGIKSHLVSKMQAHARVHLGIQTHTCHVCNERFAWVQSRDRHCRNKHGGKGMRKPAQEGMDLD